MSIQRWETNVTKPRVRFCWECGRQLRGNHHVEVEVDGHNRILHKYCYQKLFPEEAKRAKKGNNGGLHHP